MNHGISRGPRKREDVTLPKGVMRIKLGYNPNSSSIGTVVYVFPFAFPVACTVLAVLAALRLCRKRDGSDAAADERDESERDGG
jgi:hypothetical protein